MLYCESATHLPVYGASGAVQLPGPTSSAPLLERTAIARIFINGSSDGLGRLAAQVLVSDGHEVVLHARNPDRGQDAMTAVPGASAILTGDFASIA